MGISLPSGGHRRRKPFVAALLLACAALLTACGGGASAPAAVPGQPVPGGSIAIAMIGEPRNLDPMSLGNAGPITAVLGNALYGTLLTDVPGTSEIRPGLAESLTSDDGGSTYTLTLRPGLTFNDGTPLDAAAVAANWTRQKDPAVGSQYQFEVGHIAATEVVDATHLRIRLVTPLVSFPRLIIPTSLNWIASPTAMEAGKQAFDAKPVGAGPFVLDRWTRNGAIELSRNARYWDAPKPYLDRLTITVAKDTNQRWNSVQTGNVDLAVESSWLNIDQARNAGMTVDVADLNGGLYIAMNARRAPFDDLRARRAVAAALDIESLITTVYDGHGEIPKTLFTPRSPHFGDTPLPTPNRDEAQRLFDELAAEGKPVKFTFMSFPSTENQAIAQSVQTQLRAFRNVQVEVQVVDLAVSGSIRRTHDFDMVVQAAAFTDPDPKLWEILHSSSSQNMPGVSDPETDAALEQGRRSTDPEERRAAYDRVSQRLAVTTPMLFFLRSPEATIANPNVGGIVQYGLGSLVSAELWITQP